MEEDEDIVDGNPLTDVERGAQLFTRNMEGSTDAAACQGCQNVFF
jgi:hypothetical protein